MPPLSPESRKKTISPLFGGHERAKSGTVRKEDVENKEPKNLEQAQASLQEVQEEMKRIQENVEMLEKEMKDPSPESPLGQALKQVDEAALALQSIVAEIEQLNREYSEPLGGKPTPKQIMNHLGQNRDSLLEVTRAANEYDEAVALLEARQNHYKHEYQQLKAQRDHLNDSIAMFMPEAKRRERMVSQFSEKNENAA